MVFGKGGWAGSNATLKVNSTHPTHGGAASKSEFVDGWTIGGGIEYAAWNSVIIGVEYDYIRLNLTSGGSCPISATRGSRSTAPLPPSPATRRCRQ